MHDPMSRTLVANVIAAAVDAGHVPTTRGSTLSWFRTLAETASALNERYDRPVLETASTLVCAELRSLDSVDAETAALLLEEACDTVHASEPLHAIWDSPVHAQPHDHADGVVVALAPRDSREWADDDRMAA